MFLLQQARTWYPNDDIHGWGHISRVYHLAEKLACAEGADSEIACAAALLHDAADADPNHKIARASHQHASAAFARRVLSEAGWPEERIQAVEHCIRAHRYRDRSEEPQTLEAKILFDADKLDAIGAIGVARAVAHAAMSGQPLYAPPSEAFLRTGKTADGEPHSAYHEYAFKLRHIRERLYTPSARQIAEERHRIMAAYFEHLQTEMQG
ncbi:MAG: HD domain-containing protein [Anaerolineae bacterium]|nr:MAG: HD domain-containing protein [Anaerolineae bacterium]